MVLSLVRSLGRFALEQTAGLHRAVRILDAVALRLLRLALFNRAVAAMTVRQIYYTGVQALPIVVGLGLVLGTVTVHYILLYLTSYGGYDFVGTALITALLQEIAPLAVAVLLLLRSGTAIMSELGIMKIRNEFETLRIFAVSREDFVYLPRLAALAVCGPALTVIFALVALLGGFLILGYVHNITFDSYLDQLIGAVTVNSLFIVLAKSVSMATAIGLVSLSRGMTVSRSYSEIPSMLVGGMMFSIFLILVLEVFITVVAAI